MTSFTPFAGTQLAHGATQDFVNPLVREGELTIEQQLPGNMSVSVGYLMSRGLHLPVFVDGNLGPTTTTHTYKVLNASGAVIDTDTEPFYTVANRINPTTGIILVGQSVVNSWYNAGVLTFRKPMNHGLELLVNYTYSKSIDDGAVAGANGTFFGTDPPVDPLNQRRENALSDLDQRHRFVGSLVYTPLMFSKLSNRAMKAVLDGWAFSSVMTFASAQPLFATINGFPIAVQTRASPAARRPTQAAPPAACPLFEGRNVYFGHPLYNIDLRIGRQFTLYERLHLQVQGEAFNLFHQHQQCEYRGVQLHRGRVGSLHYRCRGGSERLPGSESDIHGAHCVLFHQWTLRSAPVAAFGKADVLRVGRTRASAPGFSATASFQHPAGDPPQNRHDSASSLSADSWHPLPDRFR
ncbi:MAG: hypothetical protein ABSB35_40850 [Bryobacteraceae bacterium]